MATTVITQQTRRRSVAWWFKRIALAFVALILVGVGVFVLVGVMTKATLKAKYPPIGQMVDVGGYKLHLYCQGTGSPNRHDGSRSWQTGCTGHSFKAKLPSLFVPACMTAQATAGGSPQPRSVSTMVNELHSLLSNANIVDLTF